MTACNCVLQRETMSAGAWPTARLSFRTTPTPQVTPWGVSILRVEK